MLHKTLLIGSSVIMMGVAGLIGNGTVLAQIIATAHMPVNHKNKKV